MSEHNVRRRSIGELSPGFILKENIGGQKELLEGTILDLKGIELLRSMGVEEVDILDPEESRESREDSTRAVSNEISRKIEEIFNQPRGVPKALDPGSQTEILSYYSQADREEAAEVLQQVAISRHDIQTIESGEKVSLKEFDKILDRAIKNVGGILTAVFENKYLNYSELSWIVDYFISLTGPKREASFLLLGVMHQHQNLIVRHAVNTCLLSLAIAIEMSKIMDAQLSTPEVRGDINKLKICSFKIFTRGEMVKLGIAALLSDLFLFDAFPDIHKMDHLSSMDEFKLHLHPSRAFSFLMGLDVDYDVRKAVLQHHEKIDRSGFPDSLDKKHLTKYALILSFADHYEFKTSKNPFERRQHPQRALMEILHKERARFDDDVIFAFCKAASMYPVGSWVILSDRSTGLVVKSNRNNLKRPIVKVAYDPAQKGVEPARLVDLSNSELHITDIIDVEAVRHMDGRYERHVFEERESDRVDVSIPVYFNIKDTAARGEMLTENLSDGGMQLNGSVDITKGQHVSLDFELSNRLFSRIHGIVTWKKPTAAGGYSYGIRFLNMGAKDFDALRMAIREMSEVREPK